MEGAAHSLGIQLRILEVCSLDALEDASQTATENAQGLSTFWPRLFLRRIATDRRRRGQRPISGDL